MEEKKLQDIEFPLVFKICIAPSFNVTAIAEAGFGYMGGFSFFRLSKSVFFGSILYLPPLIELKNKTNLLSPVCVSILSQQPL